MLSGRAVGRPVGPTGYLLPKLPSAQHFRKQRAKDRTMAEVNAATEAEPKLSIQEQLLLAQAVHQAQPREGTEQTVDWEQVAELLHGFQQARKTEDWHWLHGTSFNPEVCSNVYANICKTYLEDKLDQKASLDAHQTLTVARQLYEVHLKSIAEALLEEEKRSQSLQTEIEAIKRGEWDDKLRLIADCDKPTSPEAPQVQSPKPPDSHPASPSNPEIPEQVEENDVDKQSEPGSSLAAPVSLGRSAAKKSPISRTKRAAKKEIQDPSNSTEVPPENNDASLGNADVPKSRKRKAAPTSVSQRKLDKTPRPEPEKPSVTTASDSSESPKGAESPASDDDETVIQQLIGSRDRPTPSGPVTRKTRKVELEANEPVETKPSSHKPPQNKKIKSEHEDPPDPKTPKILDKSLRSRTAKVTLTPNKEKTTVQEEPAQDSETNPSSTKPLNHESPGTNVSTKGPEESHSAAHSPSSNKKLHLDNDHSADASRVGTPNSASFATGITDGNSTANQTPNSAKLPLFPADASSAGPRHGSSSTTSDPTSFRRRMLKTHSSVQSNPISSIFRDPVKESEAPGYTSIVKRPMDLRTLAKKLRDGKVTTTEEYRRDLMLMLANAVMFNHEDSEVTKHAKELMVECDRLVSIFMRGSRY
ncbi:hypothetical protein PTTG_02664 [Puccinia triticina 1-1 BBBD Race 1]|uniref:Bromo domain-containing protein n=1 Tax=Puccinia triticina (isolate 1-1 / race 1 (BBBD)) TaxID=630390 RepID=A0A180GHB6_PUCT1|nr:hypothetical protein PTTG_02664 [Puccinia triticina 1-1 BBBD Race 1]